MDFFQVRAISHLDTYGRTSPPEYVLTYSISYSTSCANWLDYKRDGVIKVNCDYNLMAYAGLILFPDVLACFMLHVWLACGSREKKPSRNEISAGLHSGSCYTVFRCLLTRWCWMREKRESFMRKWEFSFCEILETFFYTVDRCKRSLLLARVGEGRLGWSLFFCCLRCFITHLVLISVW